MTNSVIKWGRSSQPNGNIGLNPALPKPTLVFNPGGATVDLINGMGVYSGSVIPSTGPGGRNASFSRAANSSILLSTSPDAIFTNSTDWTIVVSRRKKDLNLNVSDIFSYDTGGGGVSRISAHCPYVDGNIYWDAGNASTGRLTISGQTFDTKVDNYVFVASGIRGREVYRRGALIGSNTSTIARSSVGTLDFRLGYNVNVTDCDDEEIYLFAVYPYALSINLCTILSDNPWKIFAPDHRNSYVYTKVAAASSSAALSASGVGIANFTGQSLNASTLSGAGVGVATLTGKSLFNSTLSGSGVGVGSFTGASLSASTLSGAGIGVGSFLGASLSTSTLSSSGLGVASLAGKSLFNSTLTAAGLGLSSFVGASTSSGSAVLSAAGVGLGSFTGQSLAASTMAGAGAGLATLTGASLSNSTLSSVGIGVASFVSPSSSNSFTASGLATVNFTGSARASSTLTATGLSIVNFGSPFTAIIADPKYTIYSHTRDYKSSSQKRNYNIER